MATVGQMGEGAAQPEARVKKAQISDGLAGQKTKKKVTGCQDQWIILQTSSGCRRLEGGEGGPRRCGRGCSQPPPVGEGRRPLDGIQEVDGQQVCPREAGREE